MKKMTLVWHEAGNEFYTDRYISLSKKFRLKVLGFTEFQKKKFKISKLKKTYKIKLYKPIFSFHWLSVFSINLLKELIKDNSKIIYIHEEPHSLLAFLILMLKKRGTIYILDAAVINLKLNFKKFNIFENFVYKKIDYIFYRNDFVKKKLIQRGAPKNKLVLEIGNGVKYNYKKRKKIYRNKLFKIGYVGKIIHRKGLHLICSFLEKYNFNNQFKLFVVGKILDNNYFKKINKYFTYYGEINNFSKLKRFYQSCDFFVCPSISTKNWKEQFGRVIIESISNNRLVIGSSSGFIPKLVLKNATFRENNVKDLSRLIKKISNNVDLANKILVSQSINLVNNFTWDSIALKINKFINNEK